MNDKAYGAFHTHPTHTSMLIRVDGDGVVDIVYTGHLACHIFLADESKLEGKAPKERLAQILNGYPIARLSHAEFEAVLAESIEGPAEVPSPVEETPAAPPEETVVQAPEIPPAPPEESGVPAPVEETPAASA